jgi:hypothetical protein
MVKSTGWLQKHLEQLCRCYEKNLIFLVFCFFVIQILQRKPDENETKSEEKKILEKSFKLFGHPAI